MPGSVVVQGLEPGQEEGLEDALLHHTQAAAYHNNPQFSLWTRRGT